MAEFIGMLFTSILSGGATGLFGVAIQRFFDLQNKKLDQASLKDRQYHEQEMKRIDLEIMEKEWEGRIRVAEVETEGKSDVAESQAFAASFQDPKLYSANIKPDKKQGWTLVILDFIRGIVRPALTLYLCALTTIIYFHAKSLLITRPLEAAQALDLVKMIISTILYLTTTCVLWWFGTRNKQKAPKI